MRKRTKTILIMVCVTIILFGTLNIFFPHDGYYYSLARCERSDKSVLSGTETILKCETDTYIYEITANDNGELYVMQIKIKSVLGIKKYKIAYIKGYSIEKALDYYEETNLIKWTNCPEMNIYQVDPVFSWCLVKSDSTVSETPADGYEYLDYNGEECVVLYSLVQNKE